MVIAGDGRAFCAGLDKAQFEVMQGGAADVVADRERLGAATALGQQAVHVWSLVPVPVIAAFHGVASGGGPEAGQTVGVGAAAAGPDGATTKPAPTVRATRNGPEQRRAVRVIGDSARSSDDMC